MKNTVLVVLSIAVLFSCCEKNKESTVAQNSSSAEEQDPTKSDPISIHATSQMISSLIGEKPLENLMRRKSFGGFFPARLFKLKSDKTGVMFYYCLNTESATNELPEFFLAMRQVAKYDSIPADSAKLYVPETFRYSITDSDTSEIREFIERHTTARVFAPRTINGEAAKKFMRNFEVLIASPDSGLYAKYTFALFTADEAYLNFIRRDPEFVRYYSGMIWDTDHKPNYFRPILVGVDVNGRTITTKSKKKSDQPFLQKSWPPPPNL